MARFDMIAFDADDTLWHNEGHYTNAQATLKQLLAHYHTPEWIDEHLYQTEMRNLEHFGYGIKGFALSMIETAVELSEGRISASEIKTLIDAAKAMLQAPVDMLEYTIATLEQLAPNYPLLLVTKGDLHDQELKIGRSGVTQFFRHIEIVSNKRPENYAMLLKRYNIAPERFLMVGNSLRSDILPVLSLGAQAVYIPYEQTWAHETATPPTNQPGFHELTHLGMLPDLIRTLEQRASFDTDKP